MTTTTLTLPKGTKRLIAPHLYYKKYPFKFTVTVLESSKIQNGTWGSWANARLTTAKVAKQLATTLKGLPSTSYRKRVDWYECTFFFEHRTDLENFFIEHAPLLEKKKLSSKLYAMTEKQADAAKMDAKLQFRKDLFFGKFEYRLEVKGLTDDDINALESQFFTDSDIAKLELHLAELVRLEANKPPSRYRRKITKQGRSISNDRARMQYPYHHAHGNTILYCKDEQDAALARIMMPNEAKIYKAVVV